MPMSQIMVCVLMHNLFMVRLGSEFYGRIQQGIVVILGLHYWKCVVSNSLEGIPIPPRWVAEVVLLSKCGISFAFGRQVEKVSRYGSCVNHRMFRPLCLGQILC